MSSDNTLLHPAERGGIRQKDIDKSLKIFDILAQTKISNDKIRTNLEEKEKLWKEYNETKLKLARLEKELAIINEPVKPEPKPEPAVKHYTVKPVLKNGKWILEDEELPESKQ